MEERIVESSRKSLVFRVLAFQAFFLVLHFAYSWWPSVISAIFSGIDESVFQHMKIGFFAWTAVSVAEYFLIGRKEVGTFVASRMLCAVYAPCTFVILWYLAPAFIGRMPNDLAEILWANAIVLASGVFSALLEDKLSERRSRPLLLVFALILYIVFFALSIRFTQNRPWIDLFAPPPL